jgi:GH25 family lysozyme M1 (1,4-beta-N-acetylmuramidase)
MLDLEIEGCSNLSTNDTIKWIQDFVNTYQTKTGRYPLIYTNSDWWHSCTGNTYAFKDTVPFAYARWNSEPGSIPGGWKDYTVWQYNDKNKWGGDSDRFNGDLDQLKAYAAGTWDGLSDRDIGNG